MNNSAFVEQSISGLTRCGRMQAAIASSSSTPAGISKLDSNLLAHIIFLASMDDDLSSGHSFDDAGATARSVAQVSRRWRFLALHNKAIWTGPALDWYSPSKWVAEVLRRSDPFPLEVVIPHDAANRCPLNVSLSLMHMSRIRVLQLELVANSWWFISQSKQFRTQAPLLERFSLVISPGLQTDSQMCVTGPRNMFGGCAPRLQHIHIQNCSMDLQQPVFSNLRSLFIDQLQHLAMDHLLDSLQQMKYLEKLHIVPAAGAANRAIYLYPTMLSQVYLLNLAELVVSASLTTCANILRSIVLPDACSLEIDAQDVHANGDDLTLVLSKFENGLANWTCDPLSGQQALHFGMNQVGYTIAGPSSDALSNREHPFLSLTLSWLKQSSQGEILFAVLPLLTTLFSQCPEPPDTLSISASPNIPSRLYPNIRQLLHPWLQAMSYVQALDFRNHTIFVILEKLFQGPRHNVVLPHLGDMAFFNVNFRKDRRQYWRRLLKILKFRGSDDVDAPVLQLDFVNCVGDLTGQNLSARFGTVVKVDGRDYSDGDGDDTDEASDYTVQGLSD
ncbi:hypothetical protein CPB83DRAFT_347492 [Crepidotus variabilis]|uniref:F-box domain-containing protein n=1 Tax=Crepidotus variabilis TaxID=179855 RepID=A0A9P6EG40_9AGAR|nr:hypothetical protein CPB83DRAFT_347492 [Crepidotus variabilis]